MNRVLRSAVVASCISSPSWLSAAPPAVPVELSALPNSDKQIRLIWIDTARDEQGFRVELDDNGNFRVVKTVPANVQTTIIGGLPSNTLNRFRVRSFRGGERSNPSNIASAFTDQVGSPTSCVPDLSTACLGPSNRFRFRANFKTGSTSEPALIDEARPDVVLFSFLAPDNVELVAKVLNACASTPERYWVFASGMTSVETTITVTDTQVGRTRRYFNPAGKPFATVQDTSAFATCP